MMARVLVATPLGSGGKGGIDRLMDEVSQQLVCIAPEYEAGFRETRGQGSILVSPLYLLRFLAILVFRRQLGRVDLVHVNLSSYGSAYRKLAVTLCCLALKVPYVIHLHGSDFRQFVASTSGVMRRLLQIQFQRASRVIVLGKVWSDFASNFAPGARVVILPNASRRR